MLNILSMKVILSIFLFLASQFAHGAVYISAQTQDGLFHRGEVIESYEDRWFYEAASEQTKRYLLLFKEEAGKAKFKMLSYDQIKRIRLLGFFPSKYKSFLRKNKIILKKEVVKNQAILTGNHGHHKFERMFGNFAWDLGILDEHGKQHRGDGSLLTDYYIFNEEIKSPIGGEVVGKISNMPDNPASPSLTGDLSQKINNYLTIKIQYPFYLSLVHFKKDSIRVNIGDKVKADQVLGLVGNSGVSYIPHLHYTLYIYEEGLKRFISVPALLEN